ncbi:radical SAM protein [Nocardia sp. NPDC050710]|uniref:SPL family radical SAM protein n=1 Tax=Nocardia sp. NPDC050710 TaxID=3157220 RepID=UPI0033C669C1
MSTLIPISNRRPRQIPRVFDFQTSIETIRAHHWRVFSDAYSGCAFTCSYCLYKGPGDYGRHVKVSPGSAEADPSMGILDIGTTTDPYQPIEATELRTRGILEAALAQQIPVFLLTRGTMVTRDLDVLTELAKRGLIEVCFSVITLREDLARTLEVRAPAPADRLKAAEQVAAAGIPVSFHVAPVIPGLQSPAEMDRLGYELASLSGRHVFNAVLGAQKAWWNTFYGVMEGAADAIDSLELFRAAYPRELDFERDAAVNCGLSDALSTLLPFRDGVTRGGATFVAENFPHLTTGPLEGGIYRWKLPTVYDMARWVSAQTGPVDWGAFSAWYAGHTPGDRLTGLVRGLWDQGELFVGTAVGPAAEPGTYIGGAEIVETARTTLVARRGARK